MNRRAMIGLFWFAMTWVLYEIIWSVAGVPRSIGPVLATAVAGFVAVDPLRVFFCRDLTGRAASIKVAGAISNLN